MEASWQPISTAPRDRYIIVWAPYAHGLPPIAYRCKYHPDGGFTVCELREPTLWTEEPQ